MTFDQVNVAHHCILRRFGFWRRILLAGLASFGVNGASVFPAFALSELQQAEPIEESQTESDNIERVPLPPPIRFPQSDTPSPENSEPAEGASPPEDTPTRDLVRPDTQIGKELPEVHYDLEELPEPVRRMHGLIVEAAKSGDIENLRPLIGSGDSATRLSLGGLDGDPLEFLIELSGDEEGQEILAILLEVLLAGYVHLDASTPQEMYVWPYFFAIPLETLDKRQRVELFTLVTAGDYEDMKSFGAYIFYRVGITPEGHWTFFVAGD
ncbi:hypothetical protein ACFPOD_02105 [Nitratireductor kimnyeongensis]|uniref:Fibronectin attachment protein n=1 Tax=Nitratireductor kimnyeongensis TaxID=430679 RepID=A0ABW0T4Z6_9HYPH|nr:hypothetical protein [Nitratireductor kimnyeongensis]QZZ37467.1 hypothetical protein KW403_15085 [Nitratireductor kimnyeongensis]